MLDENTKNLSSEKLPSGEGQNEKNETEIPTPESVEVNEEKKIEQSDAAEHVSVEETPKEAKEVVEAAAEEAIAEEAVEEVPKEAEKVVEAAAEEAIAEKAVEEKTEIKTENAVESDSEEKEVEKKENVKAVIPIIQFAKLSIDDLVKTLEEFLREHDIRDVRNQIEELKVNFLRKFRTLINEKKEEFVKAGGEATEFFYSSPVKNKFDELIREYKRKRQQFYKDVEREQNENLELRHKLIDELKDLIDTAEPSTMYKNFKVVQERWRAVGQIPRAQYNDVWRTYHHHVERFYDLLHLNNDFRDLDFKHNLEEKTKLVETAEKLAEDDDVNHSFKELQILHRLWKEEIGPVAREHREEVWNRFSEATKKIHKKRHELQDKLEEKYKANVDLKLAVVERIKSMDFSAVNSHKLWQDQIKKLDEFREEFFAIGKIPKSKSDEVWQRFRDATRDFNAAKNNFYKGLKKEQAVNLASKLELVEKAESLKETEEWEEATEMFKKIQAQWKTIGHVPRRDSDKIWKRFKDACNHYFDRLHEKKSDITKDQSQLIDDKKKLMDDLKSLIDTKELTLEEIEEQVKKWRNLGGLPAKVRHLENKFIKVLDAAYKKLGIEKDEADFLRFKNLMDSHAEQRNGRKLDSEQLFLRKKVDEVTKEIKQLENNISFISNASEDNPLVKNVYKNIEENKKDLKVWKRKLDYVARLDY